MTTEPTPPAAPAAAPFDARTATAAEVDAAMREIERQGHRLRHDATAARVLAGLTAQYGSQT